MAVTLRTRSSQEPKELGEMFDAVEALVAAALTPGDLAAKGTAVVACLPKVMTAVDNASAVGEELHDSHFYEAAGGCVGRLVGIALGAVNGTPPAPSA